MTKAEFENKFDKYDGIAFIHDISIYYDNYTIGVENGEEVVKFFNEGGFSLICSVNLKDIDLTTKIHEEIEMLKTERMLLLREARINIFKRMEIERKAKATAIKEFADRLKKKYEEDMWAYEREPLNEYVDNLVKEMVGD